jgi:hypothetical protein
MTKETEITGSIEVEAALYPKDIKNIILCLGDKEITADIEYDPEDVEIKDGVKTIRKFTIKSFSVIKRGR